MLKKGLSFALAVLMLLSAFSLSAFATDVFTDGDYSYVISASGAKITACTSQDDVLSVPQTLGSYQVLTLGEECFKDAACKIVNLPHGIKTIEKNAFLDSEVTDIYIPNSCETIHEEAFANAVKIYAFENACAKSFSEEKGFDFVALAQKDSFKTYVGKTLVLENVPTSAVLSADTSFVAIENVTMTALKTGTDTVSISLENGIAAFINLTVVEAPASITNLPTVINLYVGDTYAKFNPQISNGKYEGNFVYSIADKSVASISAAGVINALKPGKTTVNIRFDSISASIPLNVGNQPTDFSLNESSLFLGVGEKTTLTYQVGENQLFKKLYFTSSNESVLTVTNKGVITPKKIGVATVTAKLDTGKTATCIVTVSAAPTSIKLAKSSINIGVGESVTFKATVNSGAVCSSYLWRSDNTSIFTVDKNGTIYGKKAGTAKLFAYTYNYKSKNPYIRAYATVNVKKAPSKISFNKSNLVMGLGESITLSTVLPANTASYKKSYNSEDPAIVSITSKQVLTALAYGTTTVTVTAFNGKTGSCKITVKPAPEKVACKPTTVKLALKQSYQLEPYVNSGAVCSSYIYKTSDKKVCTVSASGLVKVKDYGSCYIYIYTYNHTKAHPISCKVKINVGYITNRIASYTTYFDRYYYGKSTNLKMACKYINGKTDGYILQPGEVFNFNTAVGARTGKRGFVYAKVIQGGTYVDGIGGGICQAASTIFNACLIGNFSILERHYHDLRSSYVPVGRDATVSWGSQNYKFKNNYKTPIRIKMTYNSGGSINCSIYTLKKVKVPKVKINVTKVKGGYKTTRKAGSKVNYTTYSYYSK